MSEVRFYHLERQTLDQALPALVSKAYENGHRIVIKTQNEDISERLNAALWTAHPNSFIPHGSKKDGFVEDQPIWLTDQDENPNGADVLIITDGSAIESEKMGDYALVCEMFDGRDDEALKSARSRWKTYKDQDLELTYWQQTDKGWEKKV